MPRISKFPTLSVGFSLLLLLLAATSLRAQSEELTGSFELGLEYEPRFSVVFDDSRPVARRVREINEFGRWGDMQTARELARALQDESRDVRIATMRALMKLGVDDAFPQLTQIVQDTRTAPAERAWAARALGRSANRNGGVDQLIAMLQSSKDPGVRAAGMDGLRRLSGQTMGATGGLLFLETADEDQQKYVDRWLEWYQQNQGLTPQEWRARALKSPVALDRWHAARGLGLGKDTSRVPDLLDQLRNESRRDADGRLAGSSAVREALARAMNQLTGRNVAYRPYPEEGESLEAWMLQHEDAIRQWKRFVERTAEAGADTDFLLLEAEEPKSRVEAIRRLRQRPFSKPLLQKLAASLDDPSGAVANEASTALQRLTGVRFPFDHAARPELKALQVARWKDWIAEFGDNPEAAIMSVFLRPERMTWGLSAARNEAEQNQARDELLKRVAPLRSLAAAHIANRGLKVSAVALEDAYREQLAICRKYEAGDTTQEIQSTLQRNLAFALAAIEHTDAIPMLAERLMIAIRARNASAISPATQRRLNDIDVIAGTIAALGNFGDLAEAAESTVSEFLAADGENRTRVRIAACLALGKIGGLQSATNLYRIARTDPDNLLGIAAVRGFGGIHQRKETRKVEAMLDLNALLTDTRLHKAVRDEAQRQYNLLSAPVRD